MKQLYLSVVATLLSLSSFAMPTPPSAITGTLAICDGGSGSLSSSPSGGTWTTDNPMVVAISSTTGVIAGVTAGTANVTYTDGTGSVTAVVTVNVAPWAITGASQLCVGSYTTLSNAVVPGTWTSSDITVASVDPATGVVGGHAPGMATISYTLGTGCSRTEIVTVNPLPPAITGTTTVCVGGTTSLASSVSGMWLSSDPSIATVDFSTGVATGITAGTAMISYALPTGCATSTPLTVVGSSVSPISGVAAVCPGGTATLTDATPGGTWSTSNPSIGIISAGGVFTGAAAGTVNILYTLSGGCGSVAVATVYPTPAAFNVTGGGTYCAGGSGVNVGLSGSQTGVTYQLYNGATAMGSSLAGTGSPISFGLQTSVGTYSVMASSSITSCSASMLGTQTVSTGLAPGAISGPSSVCVGSTITLNNSLLGGSWSTGSSSAAVDPAIGAITGLTPGTAMITYSAGTCGDVYTTIFVNPLPAAITGAAVVCAGSATATLSNTTPGGTWTSNNTSIAVIGSLSGILSGSVAGMATISYTLPTGCTSIAVATVNTMPSISGMATGVCSGSSVTLYEFGGPGTWSSSSTAIATVSSAGIVSGLSAGTVTITLTNACGIATYNLSIGGASTFDLSVTDLVNYTTATSWGYIYVTNTQCGSVSPVLTTHLSPKYTLLWSYPAATTISGNTITWNLGAISSTSAVIMVGLAPSGFISSGDTVHTDFQVDPVSGDLNTSNNYLATVRTVTGSFDPNQVTVSPEGFILPCQELTYTVQFENDGNDTAHNIYVLDTLSTNLDPASIIAVSSTDPMNMTVYSSGGYNIAKFDFPGINLPDSSHHGEANGEFVFKIKALTGLSDGATINNRVGIYFDANPPVMTNQVTNTIGIAPITGPGSVCRTATISLSNATAGGTWTSVNGRTMVSAGIVTGIASGLDTIRYTTSNSCATRVATATVSVNTVPSVAPIAGTMGMCVGATTTMTNATPGGSWTSSNSFAAPVGVSDGIVYGATPSVVLISYTLSNACGDSVVTSPLIVDPAPFAGTITGLSLVCEAATITLSNTTPGGAWTSSNTAMAVVGSAGDVSGISGGTVTISYSVSNACSTAVATYPVYVNPLADAGTISGASAVCVGLATPLAPSVSGGTWSSVGSPISVSSTGVVSGLAVGSANVYYTVTNVCSSDMAVFPIVVESLPSAGAIVVPGDVCPGHSMPLSDSVAGGVWSGGSATIASISGAGVVMAVASGTTIVSYSLTNSCGTALATAVVTVSAVPTVGTITGATMICSGESATLANTAGGGVWSGGTPGIAFVTSAGVVTALAAGTTSVSYAVSNSCGTAVATTTVAVNNTYTPLIIITANPGTVIAAGQTVTLSALVSGGGPAPDYQWMKNGVPITGQTASTFVSNTLAENDSITCRVTGTGSCGKVSFNSVIMHVVSGVVNVAANTGISVYPNPSRGILTISGSVGDRDETVSVVVTNMLGQIVYTGEVGAKNGNISTQVQLRDDLANGTYLLNIRSTGVSSQAHFVLDK
jgi:uncharacterized repeat protein (TIGR01451 family)